MAKTKGTDYKDIIKKIKEETSATDADIEKHVEDIKKRFGTIIKTDYFLYHLVAEISYGLKMPKLTSITSTQADKKPVKFKLKDFTKDRASKLVKSKQPICVEGFVFNKVKTPTRKGGEKYNFILVSESGTAMGLTAGDSATQLWEDVNIKTGDYIEIDNCSIFMPTEKSSPKLSVSQYSVITKQDTDKTMDKVIPNISENFAEDGSLVVTEGFVTDEQLGKKYQGCSKCTSKMETKEGKLLAKCKKCDGTDVIELFGKRINVFDGSVHAICNFPPGVVRKLDEELLRKLIRLYGTWDAVRKEIRYVKYEILDGVEAKKATPLAQKVIKKSKETTSGDLTEAQCNVFEKIVKLYHQATVKVVNKHLVSDAGVKDDKEAEKIIKKAVEQGIVKEVKNGTALEWCKK